MRARAFPPSSASGLRRSVARRRDAPARARPLRRVLQRRIEDPLALALLEGKYPEGATVAVDIAPDGDGVVLA
ncbi:MAG TPA: hypothetical protein VMB72_07560 [Acidimicrobiales bacterium]|nr:hypothetical protein [Acidimicrobiales bacterium]